jgi:hypothetical protein
MRKTFLTTVASLTMMAMLPVTGANATLYTFTFTSFDGALSASGEMTVDASNDVTDISGTITGLVGQTISGVVVNPSFPNAATSPDGSFVYNNLFYSSDPNFDIDGLVFSTVENTSGFWNLWGNSADNYSLWESVGGGNYPIQETGNLTVVAAPELSTWAMMLAGFAGLGLVGSRHASRSSAMNLG